jgi:hypothetical protein
MKYVAALTVVLFASPALAQSPEVGVDGATGATSYERVTTYDFEDDYVEGQLLRPDGENIAGQRHGKESSLIRIRQDFVPEMVQSVEDL